MHRRSWSENLTFYTGSGYLSGATCEAISMASTFSRAVPLTDAPASVFCWPRSRLDYCLRVLMHPGWVLQGQSSAAAAALSRQCGCRPPMQRSTRRASGSTDCSICRARTGGWRATRWACWACSSRRQSPSSATSTTQPSRMPSTPSLQVNSSLAAVAMETMVASASVCWPEVHIAVVPCLFMSCCPPQGMSTPDCPPVLTTACGVWQAHCREPCSERRAACAQRAWQAALAPWLRQPWCTPGTTSPRACRRCLALMGTVRVMRLALVIDCPRQQGRSSVGCLTRAALGPVASMAPCND